MYIFKNSYNTINATFKLLGRFNIEDYQDSGVPEDMYKVILENIDLIPNLGQKQDTMEALWLKETVLRSLERQGKTEAYYDSKGALKVCLIIVVIHISFETCNLRMVY